MAGELGQKLLPEGSDALASLTAQYRGIQFRKVIAIALGPNDGGREETGITFPEANVASAELGVYTIEDDDVMGVDEVAIAEARVLFLSCGVPDVEDHRAVVGVELNGEDLCTNGGLVGLLKLVIDLAVEESTLANATIAHKDNLIRRGRHSL
jgi:hypothetical protein